MKKLTLLFCFLSFSTFAFNSGLYHGESLNHQQVCDLALTQTPTLIAIDRLSCLDRSEGMTIGNSEPFPFLLGHHERVIQEEDSLFMHDASFSSLIWTIRSLSTPEAWTEHYQLLPDGKIHYTLVTTRKDGSKKVWFNLIFSLVERRR